MEALAHVKYVRMSPRKVQLVCDMIRGLDVKTAAAYLKPDPKAALRAHGQAAEERCVQCRAQSRHERRQPLCFYRCGQPPAPC